MTREQKTFINKATTTISDLHHEANLLGLKDEELVFRVLRAVLYNYTLFKTFTRLCSSFAKKVFTSPSKHLREYVEN